MKDMLSPPATLALMNASQGPAAAQKLQDTKQLAKAEEAATEFEAVFIAEMMKPMFEGISTESPFGGGKGEEVFRGMMLQEYGKMIAQTGSVGMASSIKAAIIQMQEEADNATQTTGQ